MTHRLRSQTTIPTAEGVPRDAVVWTFHWMDEAEATTAAVMAATVAGKVDLYLKSWDDLGTWNSALASYMRPQNAVTEVFNFNDPPPRIPILTFNHTGAATPVTTGLDLPPEVAVCINYEAAPESGLNQRRRRGRHFLGPLQVHSAVGDNRVIPATELDGIARRFDTNMGVIGGSGSFGLAVYSRSTHGGLAIGEQPPEGGIDEIPDALPAAFVRATRGWVDNAWDTQRRRGQQATTRVSFDLTNGTTFP